MREPLREHLGKLRHYTARYSMQGQWPNTNNWNHQCVLLRNIKDMNGKTMAGHLYFAASQFKYMDLTPGDIVEFDAICQQYPRRNNNTGKKNLDFNLVIVGDVVNVIAAANVLAEQERLMARMCEYDYP